MKSWSIEARRTLVLATPIIFGHLSQIMLGVVDSVMVGRLGAVPLAASALATSIFSIFLVFGFGTSSCISVMTSRANGSRNNFECGEVLRHGLFLNLALSFLMVIAIELSIPFLVYLNQPVEVLKEAKPFLQLISFSMIPTLWAQSFKNFSEAMGQARNPMIIFLLGLPLNAFLNWLLIFGNWGLPAMGLEGAGWATLITRILIAVGISVLVLRSVKMELQIPRQWLAKLSKTRAVQLLKVGVPSGFQSLFEVGAFSCAAIMMGWIGTTALAAHQIAINLASLTFMVPLGVSFAVAIRVSNAIGAGDHLAARRIGVSSLMLVFFVGVLFTLMFILGRNVIPLLYIDDPKVLEMAAILFIWAGCFQIFDGLQTVSVGALRGILDIRFPTIATFTAYWVLSLPLGYFLAFRLGWGASGVWAGLSFGLFIAAVSMGFRFLRITKVQDL